MPASRRPPALAGCCWLGGALPRSHARLSFLSSVFGLEALLEHRPNSNPRPSRMSRPHFFTDLVGQPWGGVRPPWGEGRGRRLLFSAIGCLRKLLCSLLPWTPQHRLGLSPGWSWAHLLPPSGLSLSFAELSTTVQEHEPPPASLPDYVLPSPLLSTLPSSYSLSLQF